MSPPVVKNETELATPEAAAEALLTDVCRVLNGLDYVIVGGWVPYLRSDHPSLVHPGTRDVDVLFKNDLPTLIEAVQRLRSDNFLISAKHRFQLLKAMRVGSERLVFNVDLMHPLEDGADLEMQHDIIELDIPDGSEADGKMRMKSICFSASDIIFTENLWGDIRLPCGTSIPLMDSAGLVISKCKSLANPKRERDSFDLYMTLTGLSGSATADTLTRLADKYTEVDVQLAALDGYLKSKSEKFDKNVAKYARRDLPISPAREVLDILKR